MPNVCDIEFFQLFFIRALIELSDVAHRAIEQNRLFQAAELCALGEQCLARLSRESTKQALLQTIPALARPLEKLIKDKAAVKRVALDIENLIKKGRLRKESRFSSKGKRLQTIFSRSSAYRKMRFFVMLCDHEISLHAASDAMAALVLVEDLECSKARKLFLEKRLEYTMS